MTTSGSSPACCHLLLRFLADHGLVQQHVVEHAAQRVVGVGVRGGVLHRLADGDARGCPGESGCAASTARPELVWSLGLAKTSRAPGMHHHAAVRFLVVAHAHHVDRALQAEHAAGERERAAPLPGAGLGGQPPDARPACCNRPAARRCSACGCRPGWCLRTCNRCARACRAPFPGAARGRAAWRATGGRCPSPRREYRSRAWARIPVRSAPRGRSARAHRGVKGWRVRGLSGMSSPGFNSGNTFTHALGIWSSFRRNFVMSDTAAPELKMNRSLYAIGQAGYERLNSADALNFAPISSAVCASPGRRDKCGTARTGSYGPGPAPVRTPHRFPFP